MKIKFCLPKIWIDNDLFLASIEDAGYRPDYDIYEDWVRNFAVKFVENYNSKNVPFEVTFDDILYNEANGYDILVKCDSEDLFKFLDDNLIDTKENYDVNYILTNINVSPCYGDDVFEIAWNNFIDSGISLEKFMGDIYDKTMGEVYPPLY